MRQCTCHPSERFWPCMEQYAHSECEAMAKQHRRPNKFPEADEQQAADRVPRFDSRNRWPSNDFVLGAALFLLGAIVLIAIALATGLVKP